MDYYTQFKQQADERCKGLLKIVQDLKAQIPKVEKRLADETHNRDNFTERLAKLQDLSVESLAGGQGEYDRYKTSMKKLQNDLQVSTEIVENITKNILPNAKQRLLDAERNLKIILNQVVLESRKTADAAISELLRQCVREYDGFLAAGSQLFMDYGESFVCSDESFCPGPWKADEIGDMRIRLGMIPNPEPTHEEVFRNYTSASPPESKNADTEPPVSEPSPVLEPPVPAEPLPETTIWGDEKPPDEGETPESERREVG